MKFFRNITLYSAVILLLFSCKKDSENLWKTDIKTTETVEITDISKEFHDTNVSLKVFKQKYPEFQGTVSDEDFLKRKTDESEIRIYKEAISKIDQQKLKKDLSEMFARVKHYFPQFKTPQVFLFSSALQMVREPVFYQPESNMLFIDISGFMGDNNLNYKGLELYFQKSMNPQNIVPKATRALAETMVPPNMEQQKFIDQSIFNGKTMLLMDAFLPEYPNYLKINYTPDQYEWANINEANIWNYFVENNLVFSDDQRLRERFFLPGPFSKFYTSIDNESSPQIAIFTGWQICKSYFAKHPDTKLQDFLNMNATEIFNQSEYKPKN